MPADTRARYLKSTVADSTLVSERLYGGAGAAQVRMFFRDSGAALPALLMTYRLPPGASEGVHTHRPGDPRIGSYDEFYYVIEGCGRMLIESEQVPVQPGDQIYVPNGVAHGIENTGVDCDLLIYLVAITRD